MSYFVLENPNTYDWKENKAIVYKFLFYFVIIFLCELSKSELIDTAENEDTSLLRRF